MKIKLKTNCRAAQKHYILVKVTDVPAACHLEVACKTCVDPTFPKLLGIGGGVPGDFSGDAGCDCAQASAGRGESAQGVAGLGENAQASADGEYVLVLPQIARGTQTVEFLAVDASGAVLERTNVRVSEARFKWTSRLNYKLHPAAVARIRNFDGFVAGRGAWFLISDIVPDKKIGIYRGICRLAPDVEGHAQIICTGGLGRTYTDVTILKDGVRTSPRDEKTRYREIEFSMRLPLSVRSLRFSVKVGGASVPGERTMGAKEIEAMLQNSRKYTVTAQNDPAYANWFAAHRASAAELYAQRMHTFATEPTFSIVVPLYKTKPAHFRAMVNSVLAQTYPFWQLVLVNASPDDTALAREVARAAAGEVRITVVDVRQNGGISANTNAGIAQAAGDFVCFLDHDDLLEPDCLFEYARVVCERPATDVLYCDEDNLTPTETFASPFFKPPFSPAQLESRNYICHFLAIRREVCARVGLLNPAFDGAQDYDLVLRATEAAREVAHVPRVLYHWRQTKSSTAADINAKPYAKTAGVRALQAHLDRLNVAAKAKDGAFPTWYRVDYTSAFCEGEGEGEGGTAAGAPGESRSNPRGRYIFAEQNYTPPASAPYSAPLVSVVIPNKDASGFLTDCVKSICELGGYPNFEIIVVENNSTDASTFTTYEKLMDCYDNLRVITWEGERPGEFNFSAIVNAGVREAKGELLLLLNNDTRAISAGWVAQLAGGAMREGVGIVGAKLYYADDTIQHAGVSVTNECARHINLGLPEDAEGYFGSAIVTQNFSAVTAAAMMVTRVAFDAAGGFDEGLAIAFNDVDFCLKVREAGLDIVFDADVLLYHFESVSRGYEDTEAKMRRFGREIKRMRARWAKYYELGDPYINPNFIGKDGFNQYFGLPPIS